MLIGSIHVHEYELPEQAKHVMFARVDPALGTT